MTTVIIIACAIFLALVAGGAVFLLREPRTDKPPRPEGLTPELRSALGKLGRHSDLGRGIVGNLAQADGSGIWPSCRGRIRDPALREALRQDLDGCLTAKVPLRKVFSAEEYGSGAPDKTSAKGKGGPFRPANIHSTVRTLTLRFYLMDHNRELLSPPRYTPVILPLDQQPAYLERMHSTMSQAAWVLKRVRSANEENFLKVLYAARSVRRPYKEMREAAEILFPGHPQDYFFAAAALRQWFLLLQGTLSGYLEYLIRDYEERRHTLVNRVRAQEALRRVLEPKQRPGFRVLFRYRVTRGGHSAECDALILTTTGIYPVEARSFGRDETPGAEDLVAPGVLRAVFLWDYFLPALEKLAPGVGSDVIRPILCASGRVPYREKGPCAILRPESVEGYALGAGAEVFTPAQVDELCRIFVTQEAPPSTYALPDYAAVLEVLEKGMVKEFDRLRKVADQLPHRTYTPKT